MFLYKLNLTRKKSLETLSKPYMVMVMKRSRKPYIKNEIWNPCPMGTLNKNRIECYYFGITEIKDCNKCNHRK